MATTEQVVKRTLESKNELNRLINLSKEHEYNSEWIARNLEDLKKKFSNKYIAVRKRSVIDNNEKLIKLITTLKEKYVEIDDVTIEYVTEKPIKFLL